MVKANRGRQGHWLMLFVEVLPLFQTPIIFHPLAFRPSFQVCRALGQRVGGTTKKLSTLRGKPRLCPWREK